MVRWKAVLLKQMTQCVLASMSSTTLFHLGARGGYSSEVGVVLVGAVPPERRAEALWPPEVEVVWPRAVFMVTSLVRMDSRSGRLALVSFVSPLVYRAMDPL